MVNYPIFAHHFNNGRDLVAQLVEQYTFNVWVLGSSPSGITEKNLQTIDNQKFGGFFFLRCKTIV